MLPVVQPVPVAPTLPPSPLTLGESDSQPLQLGVAGSPSGRVLVDRGQEAIRAAALTGSSARGRPA